MDETEAEPNDDLISEVSDTQLLRWLLADLHDDLPGRIQRFRYLVDLSGTLGQTATMIFGGTPAHTAFAEARSSFVNGNFAATIVLCQSLAEHLLAAFLHYAGESLPARIGFDETLRRCRSRQFLSDTDVTELKRLMNARNPITHFRLLDDHQHIDRRAMNTGDHPMDLLKSEAYFAVSIAIRLLGRPPFRVDSQNS